MAYSADAWKSELEECRKKRDKLVTGVWRDNVAFRVQKPFKATDDSSDDEGPDQIAVPADWSRSRAKSAALFSRIPRVSLSAAHSRYRSAVPIFEKIVNHYIPLTGAAGVMEECDADVVNASGICAAIAKYEATFAPVEVPKKDIAMLPPAQQLAMLQAKQVEMVKAPQTISERYRWYRISPSQLLWPDGFRGSDWQRAKFLGYDGAMQWAEAVRTFNLADPEILKRIGVSSLQELKEKVCSEGEATVKTLAGDQRLSTEHNEQVRFSELFYWAAMCDPEEKRFDAIKRIVFLTGIDEPIIDEPYAGQEWVEEAGEFIGATRLPIEVQTLTYVSDKAIPPSDSEIGRPCVLEQIRSRSQMILQRTRNIPVRAFDPNRVDPTIQDLLMRGTWQGMIPIVGRLESAIQQIAPAAYPRDDYSFDHVSNRDLDDAWSMSPNQMGNFSGGERSASEANIIANAYASVIGFQREKMVSMFLGLVTTTMGLIQLNLDQWDAEPIVGKDGVERLDQWDRKHIAGKFVATIRQDSSVLQDSNQRIQQLMRFLNIAGKSGRINIDPILTELAALSGLDPAEVIAPPQQPRTEPMNVSYRLSGVEDLHDPIAVSLLIKAGQAPNPQEVAAAKLLIADALRPFEPQQATPGAQPAPGAAPNPDWSAMPRVTKRPEELGG